MKLSLEEWIHSAWSQSNGTKEHLLKRKAEACASRLLYFVRQIIHLVWPLYVLVQSWPLLTGSIGRCYSENVLKEYMKFCSRNGLHIISDEIYALSVWNNPRLPNAQVFVSILSIDLEGIINPSFVHTVWGLSKVMPLSLPSRKQS